MAELVSMLTCLLLSSLMLLQVSFSTQLPGQSTDWLVCWLLAQINYKAVGSLTRVLTSPARGAKCLSFGMKPTTSLWVCTLEPPTPSPSRPALRRALDRPPPPGLPPKFQVSDLERERKKGDGVGFYPLLIYLGVEKGGADRDPVILEQQGQCSPVCVTTVISRRKPNPGAS